LGDGHVVTAKSRVTVAKKPDPTIRFADLPTLRRGTRSVRVEVTTVPGAKIVSTVRTAGGAIRGRTRGRVGPDGHAVQHVKLRGWRGCRCLTLTTHTAEGEHRATRRVRVGAVVLAARPRVTRRGALAVWGSAPRREPVRVQVRDAQGAWVAFKRTKAERRGALYVRVPLSGWRGQRQLAITLARRVQRDGVRVWVRDVAEIRLTPGEIRALRASRRARD
jgi:hypothetical protein